MKFSFCPFPSSFCGNPIELILLCFKVSHVSESLFTLFHYFFIVFLRLGHLSCFKFDDIFFFPAQICCLTLVMKFSYQCQLQNFNSLLFYNFSSLIVFSETLFSLLVLVLKSWFPLSSSTNLSSHLNVCCFLGFYKIYLFTFIIYSIK